MNKEMNDLMKRVALYSLSGALIFSLPACNQGREAADEDSLAENGAITEMEELRDENEIDQVRNEGYYTEWDADRNGALNQDEFRESWNTNMEGEEFNDATFGEWDANRDSALDENEFKGGLWGYYNKDKNEGLKRSNGNPFVSLKYVHADEYIFVDWNGYLDIDLVKQGSEALLKMILETQARKTLISNEKVSGPWSKANEWYANSWNPRARSAGLAYMSVIMSDSIPTQISLIGFERVVNGSYTVYSHYDKEAAREWLINQN